MLDKQDETLEEIRHLGKEGMGVLVEEIKGLREDLIVRNDSRFARIE